MLQPQTAGQPDDRTKHKFMVQWVAVPNSYTDDVDNFVRRRWKNCKWMIASFFLVETRFENFECSRFKIKMCLCR